MASKTSSRLAPDLLQSQQLVQNSVQKQSNLGSEARVQVILKQRTPISKQDREFLLHYASDLQPFSDSDHLNAFYKNLIVILDHFLSHGFIRPSRKNPDCRATHYWQLINRYFGSQESVSFIEETMSDKPETTRALCWLILALNERELLVTLFDDIFTNGSFLAHYDEEVSYLFLHREQLRRISKLVYEHHLFSASALHQKYA
jgi:hypothetical protein